MTEQQTKRMVIKLGVDEQVDFYLGALPVFLPGMEGIVDDMTGKSSQLIDMVDLAIQTADQHIEGHQSEGLTHNKPVFMGANGPYYIDLKTIEAVDAQQSLPYRTIIPRGEVGKQDVGEFLKGDPNKPIFKDDDGNYS